MRNLLIVFIAALTLAACNKDQKAVNTLEGSWGADKLEVTHVILGTSLTSDLIEEGGSAIFTFNKCKLKKDEWCSYSIDIFDAEADTTFGESGMYRVTNDGVTIETKETEASEVQTITIEELTKTDLKINYVSEDLDGPVVAEFSR